MTYKAPQASRVGVALDPISVAQGLVPGAEIFSGFGERDVINTTAAGEDIWLGAATTIPTPADAGEALFIVSDDAADDVDAGTGVRSVEIHYLDANGLPQAETVDMEGLTPVALDATNVRFVQRIHTATVGSGGVAAGDITIYKSGDAAAIYSMIQAGGNSSLVPHRMVPAGKRLIVYGWHATESKTKEVAFRIRTTSDDDQVVHPGIFLFKDSMFLSNTTMDNRIAFAVPALAIIKVSGWAVVGGARGSCGWDGILIDA